jgi:hypothetical protein
VLTRLVAMKARPPLYLVFVGSVMILVGVILTVVLLVRREHCDGVSSPVVCQGYTNSLHWTYPVVALGVICFIAAGLFATKFLQHPGQTKDSVSPPRWMVNNRDSKCPLSLPAAGEHSAPS